MEYILRSANQRIEVKITLDEKIRFSVFCNTHQIIQPSSISLDLGNGNKLGLNPFVMESLQGSINDTLYPVIRQKCEKIINAYNELKLMFRENFSVIFLAYDLGVTYRFETSFQNKIRIFDEEASFHFTLGATIYFPEEDSFVSHNERDYQKLPLREIKPGKFCGLPLLVETRHGIHVLITEADLFDYPGLWL